MARNAVESTLLSALQELGRMFGEERVMNTAGHVLQTAAQTKAAVDGNVATVLGLAGLPTRADVEGLRRQLDVVQATLANLSRKVDRLLEEHAHKEPAHPAAARRRRPRTRPGSDSTPG